MGSKSYKVIDLLKLISKLVKSQKRIRFLDKKYLGHYVKSPKKLKIEKGKNFKTRIEGVLTAKRNEISPKWRIFFNKRVPEHRPIFAQLHIEELREFGIESTEVSMSNDSTHFYFHTVITQFDSLSFQVRKTGKAFEKQTFTKNLINIHFDVDRLKQNEKDPISIILNKLGRKINFPTKLFLNAWDGDVSYRQGGFQTIKEEYITSELDENFEVTDVVSYRDVKVAGFDLFLSMKEKKHSFSIYSFYNFYFSCCL